MQYEQPRGLASAVQYQNQHPYFEPRPYQNPGYLQTSQPPTSIYRPPPGGVSSSGLQSPNSYSPYDPEHPPPLPPKAPEHTYNLNQYQQPPQPSQYQQLPSVPQRHQNHFYNTNQQIQQGVVPPQSPYEQVPPLPPRNQSRDYFSGRNNMSQPNFTGAGPSTGFSDYNPNTYVPPPPPRPPQNFNNAFAANDDPSDPIHYTRDPHKLVGYLVPFPKPQLPGVDPSTIPTRFLIYTPPPPPLSAPKEGEKEGKLHKVQRKWQDEVRSAKASNAKVASWQGVKSRATKAIAWGVNQTTTSNLEFLGRVSDNNKDSRSPSPDSPTPTDTSPTTKKTVGVSEILLVYPPSMNMNDTQMREEFVNTMLRTKSKAQRDSIIATGLLPVSFGIDIMATLIWPFGGLGEIDSVWLYSSLRGAKTAHSVTKRLTSSSDTGNLSEDTLQLNFTPSARLDVLSAYLDAECHRVDGTRFPVYGVAPTETQVLSAIGWEPSQSGGVERNWEDEQWEMSEVKDDVKSNMHKGAKEWRKFCVAFEKDPEKALKKK